MDSNNSQYGFPNYNFKFNGNQIQQNVMGYNQSMLNGATYTPFHYGAQAHNNVTEANSSEKPGSTSQQDASSSSTTTTTATTTTANNTSTGETIALNNSNVTGEPPKKKILHRKKHKNSRLGCPQCKQRRIKCDETLPSCQKCISRSIKCGYLDYSDQELNIIKNTHIQMEFLKNVELEFQMNGAVPGDSFGSQSMNRQLSENQGYAQYGQLQQYQQSQHAQQAQQQLQYQYQYAANQYNFQQHYPLVQQQQQQQQQMYYPQQQQQQQQSQQYLQAGGPPPSQAGNIQQQHYQINPYDQQIPNHNNDNKNAYASAQPNSAFDNINSINELSYGLNLGGHGNELFGVKHDSIGSLSSSESSISNSLLRQPQPQSQTLQRNTSISNQAPHEPRSFPQRPSPSPIRFHTPSPLTGPQPPPLPLPLQQIPSDSNSSSSSPNNGVILMSNRTTSIDGIILPSARQFYNDPQYLNSVKNDQTTGQTTDQTTTPSSATPSSTITANLSNATKQPRHKDSISYMLSKEAYDENLLTFTLGRTMSNLPVASRPIEQESNVFHIPLIPHAATKPKYTPEKFPSFFGDTFANVMARVYSLIEIHDRILRSWEYSELFNALLLQASGVLSSVHHEFEDLALYRRGVLLSDVGRLLATMNDDNVVPLLILTSLLNSSSILVGDLSTEEYIRSNTGSAVLLINVYENPDKFPKSFIKLKNFADSILFTSKFLWTPAYNDRVLAEFADIVKAFTNLSKDPVSQPYIIKINNFLEFLTDFIKMEKSNLHVLNYPISKLHELFRVWYKAIPLEMYTINADTPSELKVIFCFWYTLGILLEEIFSSARYVFTFLFHGFHLLHTFQLETIHHNMDTQFQKYVNYCCRIMGFLSRRKSLILRANFIAVDFDSTKYLHDLKNKAPAKVVKHVKESCITNFRTTIIKPENYPVEKTPVDSISDEDDNIDHSVPVAVDFLDVDPSTSFLNVDYDPRFTDPLFNENLTFQSATLEFLKGFLNDRKMLIELDYYEKGYIE